MDFKNKYFKYKNKYLNLKKQLGASEMKQLGGSEMKQLGGSEMTWRELLNEWKNATEVPYDLKKLLSEDLQKTLKNFELKDIEGLALKFDPFSNLEENVILRLEILNLPNNQDSRMFDGYLKYNENLNEPKEIISFLSFGKDSIMIVPKKDKGKNYVNIQHFLKNADMKKQVELWKKTAEVIENTISNNTEYEVVDNSGKKLGTAKLIVKKPAKKEFMSGDKIYLNTHGGGVSYLHIRLDTFPKYGYTELKSISNN